MLGTKIPSRIQYPINLLTSFLFSKKIAKKKKEETVSTFNIHINFLKIQSTELSKCKKKVFYNYRTINSSN